MKTFSRVALVSVALLGAASAHASDRVRAAQEMLQALGYTTNVDGDFGASTQSATRRFQRANGLSVNGALDSATVAKLQELSGLSGSTSSSTTVTTSANTGSVATMQRQLSTMGYYSGAIDGQAGGATAAGIKEFQADYGYEVTGVLSAEGRARLASEYAVLESTGNDAVAIAASEPTIVSTRTSFDEAEYVEDTSFTEETVAVAPKRSEFLANAQKQLTAIGFDTGGSDGLDGPRTRSAIKAYQKSLGLEQVGRLGPKTRAALKRDYAEYEKTGRRSNTRRASSEDAAAWEAEQELAEESAAPAGPRVPFWSRFKGTSSFEVTTGASFGGDDLLLSIDGNSGFYGSVGWQYIGTKGHGFKLNLGYHEDTDTGNNRSAVSKGIPLDIMYVRKWKRFHFNAGVTTHFDKRVRENINGVRQRFEADTAVGFAAEADYDLGIENLAIGARVQALEYDFGTGNDDVSASGGSIFLRGRWK